ncbi:ESPR-type extended signal peptide-containing protein [Polynucleobacter sp. Tro8-14-1]|uniref:ESPR-type extended signal peptide-containing protein n=1 Tax=Polynucleobacter sp. Tro8-14-1 TaxID=1758383 RepID=UPI001C0E5B78|nr:ESPR-type extended signal peptide-containing protein [Polynucleobacter sp. Tro8-14-1]MBU3563166.1 hypothetical protein [Polynucleobacter sp. Tro8-14-1]
MNKTYRLIFNKSLGVMQVVSELARSRGKKAAGRSFSSKKKSVAVSIPFSIRAIPLALAIGFAFISPPVMSQAANGTAAIGVNPGVGGPGVMGAGSGGNAGYYNGFAGGGGGAGGSLGNGSGGAGGAGNGRNSAGGAGGSAGVGGPNSLGANGGIGSFSPSSSAQGGGGGGGAGFVGSVISGNITGGSGGSASAPDAAGATQVGAGGGGGVGLLIIGTPTLINAYNIVGGAGGNGGITRGGLSGAGGVGVDGSGFTLTNSGSITGGAGGAGVAGAAGVYGSNFTLINSQSGVITGGAGSSGAQLGPIRGADAIGGNGFSLLNSGSITGGLGASYGVGGSGVSGTNFTLTNYGTGNINGTFGGAGVNGNNFTLTNSGNITGGASNSYPGAGIYGSSFTVTNSGNVFGGAAQNNATGGAGIFGSSFTVVNNLGGDIAGGVGASGSLGGSQGGAGISGATITVSNNLGGTIAGGAGGLGASGYSGGDGGFGLSVTGGTLNNISNHGSINGGAGGPGYAGSGSNGGAGGTAISGAVFNLDNAVGGVITGGAGGYSQSRIAGVGGIGVSILSGSSASAISNSGSIVGGTGGTSFGWLGGNGGIGLSGSNFSLTNYSGGSILGGSGAISLGGSGSGNGGVALSGSSFTLINSGGITGGGGGNGRSNVLGFPFLQQITTAGYGAASISISGAGAIISNAGSITGGAGGAGYQDPSVNSWGAAGGVGIGISGSGTTSIANSGLITGGAGGAGYTTSGGGGVGGTAGAGVSVAGSGSTTINNNSGGSITGGAGGGGYFPGGSGAGVAITGNGATTIVNSGSITGGAGYSGGAGINIGSGAGGSINIINQGIISSGMSSRASQAANIVNNSSSLTSFTLSNAQSDLTFSGNLPKNYNIILGTNANTYGKLAASSVTNWDGGTGTTNFGIYSGLVKSTSYLDVISGVSASLFTPSSLTGNYGGYQYNLVLEAGTAGTTNMWDLLFPAYVASSNIVTNSGNYLSDVGNTLNPVFAGGTLTLLNGDNSNQAFAVNSSGGTITSPSGGSATLSGVFSGPGAMTFNGTGTTYMNGVNTYTGGTTVAGGTLSVGSSEANNTARLAGDVTVQAAGTLAGHGGIGGNVTNNGRVAPGGSIGTLSVAGNYVQTAGGTLSTSITPTANSVLAVAGTASLAGGFVIDASSGTYTKRTYTVLTSSGLTGKFSGLTGNLVSYSPLNSALSYDLNNAYLTLSAGTVDTQQSLVNTAAVLQGIYTLQNSVLANSFAYDCNVFGANDVCVSVGGRTTAVQAEGINNTSGLLIAAYRPHANYRIGAYADQNLSTNSPGGTVKLGNNTPLIGLFGAWSERLDGTGTEVKVSAAYGQKNATVTRSVVGTSDPGAGSSNLISQGAQIQAKYGFAVLPEVIVSPYVGMRYTQNNMGGYTEGASSTVTAPLTYSALNTNATTALAGLGASYRFIPRATVYASAGVETDTNTANGTYSATGVTGLTPINFNANPVKTRPTATIGAYYDVEKNQRVGINGIYRQELFQAVSTTTVMATYTIGL